MTPCVKDNLKTEGGVGLCRAHKLMAKLGFDSKSHHGAEVTTGTLSVLVLLAPCFTRVSKRACADHVSVAVTWRLPTVCLPGEMTADRYVNSAARLDHSINWV
ncbi:hypothetical protein BaRGS_00019672 [Batillaria attramentaria]|uniref:Uncharacterized protein n=1 Tax=Batillaria attramentaria TaxID=370345 RepID=A0ABD0KP60_9CAEN